MRIGVVVPTFEPYTSRARFAETVEAIEELGFDSAWFGDHIVFRADRPEYLGSSWMDAVACACLGLGMTSRLKFGTDVLVAAYRNPLLLAKMAATASALSEGRMILGLGIGWLEGEFEALGAPPFAARAQVMDELLEVLRQLYEETGALSFSGKWVSYEDVLFEPKPPSTLPLLVGGNHANALRRAALLGDGWHPLFPNPEYYVRGRAEIERIRQEAGITRPFCYSMSGSEARILDAKADLQRTRIAQEASSYAPAVGLDETGRQRFIGTAEQVVADCLEMAQAGVEQIVLRFTVPLDPVIGPKEHLQQIRRFGMEVLPHVLQA
jgi:probable F420-dependent oxidoreductase